MGSTENPMFGAPPNWITLPFGPISCASPPTPPTAAATSGSCFTFGNSDSSNAGASTPESLEMSNADLPVMTASVPL